MLRMLSVVSAVVFVAVPVDSQELSFDTQAGRLSISLGQQRIATYVWDDAEISRPYFCNLKAPDGTRVTRRNPPDPVADAGNVDHATFHPGLWLSFGDLGGADFWRLKARVRHERFEVLPVVEGASLRFAVRNLYETRESPPRLLAEERCAYTITPAEDGYLIRSVSDIKASAPGVAFGDQEEMGFGIRLDTPLTVKQRRGIITASHGGRDEAGTWGKPASWCAAAGKADGRWTGVMLIPGPDNFRPSWFHTRDYGLLVANPFGRKSMTAPNDAQAPPERTPLPEAEPMTLEFMVRVFSVGEDGIPDYQAYHEEALRLRD
ncbi:MAG: hypothetical protein RLZZ303_721 [Candidatus Hydrogenedentota bacterium]|jgi:hypothetical protein